MPSTPHVKHLAREIQKQLARTPLRGKALSVLDDGVYDVIVVDADATESADESIVIEVAIASGAHRGDTVRVNARHLNAAEPLELLGIPGTLVVRDGQPNLRLEH
jgi:hypothetical protein